MVIAGAGGHALDVLDALLGNDPRLNDIHFFDDTDSTDLKLHNQYPIIKNLDQAKTHFLTDKNFLLGVGDPFSRFILYQKMIKVGGVLKTFKSNLAWISPYVAEMDRCDVFQFSIIGAKAKFGNGTLINARSNVHHEVSIGNFVEVSPSVTILGKASIGDFCQIGCGSIVLPKVKIGSNVIVGAGTVVNKDVPDNCVVVGVPGKKIRELTPLDPASLG
jgi:sugar O-acyltransferase (sialic acid O-acetyltransferase NeuD family)